jgi:hypothetical protein
MGRTMTTSPSNTKTKRTSDTQPMMLSPTNSQYIEDVPTADLKLFFKGFKEIYKEFSVLQEMTTKIL